MRGNGRRRKLPGQLEGIGGPGAGYGWAVGQLESVAGGAHSRGQRRRSGLIYPPVVAQNEERADGWGARLAGAAPQAAGTGPAEAARYLLGWGR